MLCILIIVRILQVFGLPVSDFSTLNLIKRSQKLKFPLECKIVLVSAGLLILFAAASYVYCVFSQYNLWLRITISVCEMGTKPDAAMIKKASRVFVGN